MLANHSLPSASPFCSGDPFKFLNDSFAHLHLTSSSSTTTATASTATLTTAGTVPSSSHLQGLHPSAHPPPAQIPQAAAASTSLSSSLSAPPITVTPFFPPGDNVVFGHSSFFRRCRDRDGNHDSNPHLGRSPGGRPAALAGTFSVLSSYRRHQQKQFPFQAGRVRAEEERKKEEELPTPEQVRAEAARLGIGSAIVHGPGDGNVGLGAGMAGSSLLVPFPALGLLVKYGPDLDGDRGGDGNRRRDAGGRGVSAAEGKAMMLLRRALASSGRAGEVGGGGSDAEVCVPEVFGWRKDDHTGERFLYLALPEGEVLEQRWPGMSESEKAVVCDQLSALVAQWRRLRLEGDGFVGSVDYGPLQDDVFRGYATAGAPPPGPFTTVAAFHDYFVSMAAAKAANAPSKVSSSFFSIEQGQVGYARHLFPDDVPIVFTHGALHPRNIIVSAGPNPRVVGIIGWEQAGWYPAYWELCKARWELSRHPGVEDWGRESLAGVLDPRHFSRDIGGWHTGALCQQWDGVVDLMGV